MTSSDGGQTIKQSEHSSPDAKEHFITECYSQLITVDEGSPDISLRQANLRNFVQAISPWELIYLRSLIRETTPKLADLPDLPEEIVAIIAADLDYQDVLNCTNVSKGWRRAWTADAVAKDVARVHFPGLVELHPDVSPWSLLHPVAAKAAARAQGKYISSLHITIGSSVMLGHTPLKLDDRARAYSKIKNRGIQPGTYQPAYCDGKIAWQMDNHIFLIDDIRSMTRSLVSPPDLNVKGEKDFAVIGLSSKLLVLINRRTYRSLIVYHLEEKQYRRVALPSRILYNDILLHKDTFLITTRAENHNYVWRWGRGLVRIEIPDVEEILQEEMAMETILICHPTETSLFYLVTAFFVVSPGYSEPQTRIDQHRFFVVVSKYSNAKHVQTFNYETNLRYPSEYVNYIVHGQPMNAYGTCTLSACFDNAAVLDPDPDPETRCARSTRTPPTTILHRINFNTISETFSFSTQELKGMRRPLWNSLCSAPDHQGGVIWNDLIYYLQNHTAQSVDGKTLVWKTGFELSGLRSLCIVDKSSTQVINEDLPWFTEEWPPEESRDEWSIEEGSSRPRGCRHIAVDDDFLVAISDKGYVVWNYGDFGLRTQPWVPSDGYAWRLRLATQDMGCAVQGCLECHH
ncbi:hypothetical protein LY78DRAFT_739533 [Colletotrichum sublineola]|nr:hypothetical protein LY78DRAFT_739533 [Colletotrichum sublineola]